MDEKCQTVPKLAIPEVELVDVQVWKLVMVVHDAYIDLEKA